MFDALTQALSDVPSSRYAGTIFITDGQVHDIPALSNLHHEAPLNALITGRSDEFDRQIKFISPPRFTLVNKPQRLSILVKDHESAQNNTTESQYYTQCQWTRSWPLFCDSWYYFSN